MKKNSKAKTAITAGKTSEPTGQTASLKPMLQKKPSSHLEGSAMVRSQDHTDPIIAKNGENAYSHCFDIEDGKFAVGGDATTTRNELRGAHKRVPNDHYVCRALSRYLQGKGIRNVSSSTIYDWMRANETREQLGGKNKAPKIPISFYVAVSRDKIPIEKRGEYLKRAIEGKWSVQYLKNQIISEGQGRTNSVDSETNRPYADIATVERIISESQSYLSGHINEIRSIIPDKSSWTIDRLENYAIYIWQLRDDLANGGAKNGEDQ